MKTIRHLIVVGCVASILSARAAHAEDVAVAVAANFLGCAQALGGAFERARGHRLLLSPASSGQLYAQIVQGAPFDVLLSADAERPAQLVRDGLAVSESVFTYAHGQLALWCVEPGSIDASLSALRSPRLRHLAIADAGTAPFGAAAERVLRALGLLEPLREQGTIVVGVSIAQAHQFVASGAAQCGFVALSQVIGRGGSLWIAPETLAGDIRQDAALLKRAEHKPAAISFVAWLRADPGARELVRAAGYRTDP